MEKFRIIDEQFKQTVADTCSAAKEKISEALLTEDGKLDTDKIENAVEGTFRKAEKTVRDGCRKFSEEYVKDGALDKEKLGEAAIRTYRNAGRSLATGLTHLAQKLTDKFGVNGDNNEIFDTEVVTAEDADFYTGEEN